MPLEITTLDDPALLLEINNAAVPDIGETTLAKAQWSVEHIVLPGLALLDGQPAGIVVVYNDDCGYNSDFYRWFTERYQNFLYIDRVVVASWARGQGIARKLYQHIDHIARVRGLAVVADVWLEPPNVPSLGLHRALGYEEIGTQYFPDLQKTCAKFMKHREWAKAK